MPGHGPQAEALFLDGNRYLEAGEFDAAERCFRQALTIAPDFAEALANLALVLERTAAFVQAEACYRQAIAMRPDGLQIYLNLGVMLMKRKQFSAAEAVYRQALLQAPDSAAAWSNLGVLLASIKREDEAEHCYRTAMKFDGGYSRAQFNLAYVLLRQGRFEEGWRCLETRQWYAVLEKHFTCPRWRGEDLSGKSVVIGFEAGHGDMIQFCRYASVLKTMGAARVALVCHPGLVELFRTLSGVDELYSFEDDVPAAGWDFWTPPMSLPHYCQTRMHNIPAPIPYLAPDPAKVAKWSRLLPAAAYRIGLVWKGNPDFENDADRSLPSLDILAPLGEVAGAQFISLQKGPAEAEARRPPAGLSLLDLGSACENFADTAAVIASLDLVISVDTAVAHLAGALGKPCWILLPDYQTDWRWLTDRMDSPWYPGHMRLFRQSPGEGWPSVIAAVVEALKAR